MRNAVVTLFVTRTGLERLAEDDAVLVDFKFWGAEGSGPGR